MTWSYNTALTDEKDQVRLLIGDTDTNDPEQRHLSVLSTSSKITARFQGRTYENISRVSRSSKGAFGSSSEKGELRLSVFPRGRGFIKEEKASL